MIPDGMLAKVAGSNQFKVGQGDKTWNELEFVQPDAIQLGGGLATDQEGKIYVDFNQMPTDKFEALLKQIRVPIWLSANTNFYVDGATGSDVLSSGRGLSADMAFKTIQACVNYVCDNYNLSRYNVTIYIADGYYTEQVVFGKFTTNTGKIILKGNSSNKNSVVIQHNAISVLCYILGNYTFYNICFASSYSNSPSTLTNVSVINCLSEAEVSFYGCQFNLVSTIAKNIYQMNVFSIGGNANVNFRSDAQSTEIICQIPTTLRSSVFNISGYSSVTIMWDSAEHSNKILVEGAAKYFLMCNSGKLTKHTTINFAYPEGKTFTGSRYLLENFSSLNLGGAGEENLPGNQLGTKDSEFNIIS